ncbi:MAG: hypothetical protein J5875_12730 [Paludibacteraceae bacterium]|nr:hypothetical protein [Paludibacteraceae bacterium]
MTTKFIKTAALLLLFGIGQDVLCANEKETGIFINPEDEPEPTALFNTISARHTQIEEFDYAIALPNTGYVQSHTPFFNTIFKNEVDNSTIAVSQHGTSAVSALQRNMNAANYKRTDFIINGIKAELRKSKEENGRYRQELELNTNLPMFITAECDATDTININKLERSLLSIVYSGPQQKEKGSYSTSLFSISNGGYKVQNSGLMLSIFTQSGDFEKEKASNEKDYFQLATTKLDVKKDAKKEARKLVEGILEKDSKIVGSKKISINGKKGFDYDIISTDEGGKVTGKSYATVIYNAGRVYLFIASANKNIDEKLEFFKNIAQTLKIK